MKLYVCWNTDPKFLGSRHPCGVAHDALKNAGHDPEVVKAQGWRRLPDKVFNRSEGRQEVKELTGKVDVPVLVTDDEEAIYPSEAIVAWARENPSEEKKAEEEDDDRGRGKKSEAKSEKKAEQKPDEKAEEKRDEKAEGESDEKSEQKPDEKAEGESDDGSDEKAEEKAGSSS